MGAEARRRSVSGAGVADGAGPSPSISPMPSSGDLLNATTTMSPTTSGECQTPEGLGEFPEPMQPYSVLYAEGYGSTRKERLRLLLDEPRSSRTAFWVANLISALIIVSSVASIIETLPEFYKDSTTLLVLEVVFLFAFTVEFALRAYAHSSTLRQFRRFLRSPFTLLDVVTIVPLYGMLVYNVVSMLLDGKHPFRVVLHSIEGMDLQLVTVLRLFRLFRLFRCYTFSSFLQLSIDALLLALWKSLEALLALVVFILIVLIAFSTMMYFAERGTYDDISDAFMIKGKKSEFNSIPAAAWYVAEVLTTVGFGDRVPQTTTGKLITLPLMFFSLLIIALPSILVGRNFAECFSWLKRHRPQARAPHALMIGPSKRTPYEKERVREMSRRHAYRSMRDAVDIESGQTAPEREASRVHGTPAMATVGVSTPDAMPLSAQGTMHSESYLNTVASRRELLTGVLRELQRQNAFVERLLMLEHQERAEQDAEFGGPLAEAVARSSVLGRRGDDEEGGASTPANAFDYVDEQIDAAYEQAPN